MKWQRTLILRRSLGGAALILALACSARAETPDAVVRQVLQANPVTAAYSPATAAYRNGQVVVLGTVGTKQIHDLAIRLAITTGYPIRDDLVIDTAAAHRVAAGQAQMQAQAMASGGMTNPGAASSMGMGLGAGTVPYTYPPPLFGRLDDPFFGFEAPC